jgi:hypothetical protein
MPATFAAGPGQLAHGALSAPTGKQHPWGIERGLMRPGVPSDARSHRPVPPSRSFQQCGP